MKGSKTAVKELRRARKLMNDGGVHWTQNTFREAWERIVNGKVKKETSFCYLGGLHEAIFQTRMEDNPQRFKRPAYAAAITASAKAILPGRVVKLEERAARAETEIAKGKTPRGFYFSWSGHDCGEVPNLRAWLLSQYEDIIMQFNDRPSMEWSKVEAKLNEAADKLEREEV